MDASTCPSIHLYIIATPQRTSRLSALQAAAQFSSTPSRPSPGKPTIFESFDGLSQYFARCFGRPAVFERYEALGVFSPSTPRFRTFLLYTKLQLPPETEIDAAEFLDGARFACDLAMHTMYSREFVNFASGVITESAAATHLQRGLSRECYDAFLFAMNESSKSGNTFDLTQLDIHGAYLVGVDWEELTLADYKAEQKVAKLTASDEVANEPEEDEADVVGEIAPSDYETEVQRMRLDVRFETKEHLEVQTAAGQDETITRDSTAVWRFESLVTTPDDIDWKIVSVI